MHGRLLWMSGRDLNLQSAKGCFWVQKPYSVSGLLVSLGAHIQLACNIILLLLLLYIAHSFVDLVRYIFTIPGVKAFLSQKICQDPVEKFFGCQRQRGGTNENPTVAEFCKNTQALRVIGNFCRPSVRGNCRGNKSHLPICDEENEPLPKRRRLSKK